MGELQPYFGFCGPAYQYSGPQLTLSIDLAINCYSQKNEVGSGKGNPGLIFRPGYDTFSTPATPGAGRALWAGEQRLFAVAGTKLVEAAITTGTQTILGDIGSGTSICTITSNGNQLMVINPTDEDVYVSGALAISAFADAGGLVEVTFVGTAPATGTTVVFAGTGLAIDGSRTITKTGASKVTVDGSTWPGGSPAAAGTGSFFSIATTPTGTKMGFQLRGYGYIVASDTNTLFQSDPDDFSTWDPLKQATAKISTDRIVAVIESGGYAWLVGSATAQVWAFVGTAGFALEPIQSAFVTEGTCAPYSLATANSRVCWVTGSRRGYGRVVAVSPGRVDRISNYAVEQSLRGVTNWGTVVGSGYSSNGHDFYELYVPDLNLTWVYDFQEAGWHQRRGWTGSAYTKMKGRMTQCTFNNTYYVINDTTGVIYQQDDAQANDDGVVFRCQRFAPILASGRLTNFNAFRLDMQTNDGALTVGATARFSMDGGLSWGSYTYETMGRNGEPNVLEWSQLGQAGIRGFVADVYFDQGPFAVAGAWVDPSPGLN